MFLGSFWNKISLLGWFFRICHTGKYFFAVGESVENNNFGIKQISPEKLFTKIIRLIHGLDSESQNVCINYFLYRYHTVPDDIKILGLESFRIKLDESLFQKNLNYLQSKYSGFSAKMTPLIYSHHGLLNLPLTAKGYIRNKIFIDAGACDGCSSFLFLEYDPLKVYAFDISEKNVMIFKKNMLANKISSDQIELFRIGLGDSEKDMTFEDGKNGATTLEQSGNTFVHITTIDNFFHEIGPVGFIKADVEGFGFKMLKGMTEILKRDRPVLSLSMYHNAEEFLEMKPFLESLNLNYNIQIIPMDRYFFAEIVLIAVPNELL